jgi:ribosomal protein S19E (S16A)
MNAESSHVFLNKMKDKIDKGEYDKEITVPFMKRESIYASMKARVVKKLETGGTPVLTESEIKNAIHDAKEVAAISLALFSKVGIVEKTESGWAVTPRGEKLLPHIKPY